MAALIKKNELEKYLRTHKCNINNNVHTLQNICKCHNSI